MSLGTGPVSFVCLKSGIAVEHCCTPWSYNYPPPTVISTVDDEYKTTEGFKNYYGIAHLYKEKVTEQPAMMRFGKLKPYQVRNC